MSKFQPGQSGNPGGRPKETSELKALAREHGPEVIERLLHWLRSDNAKASVSAASILLERGFGKVPQAVIGDDEAPAIKVEWTDKRRFEALKSLMERYVEPEGD